MNAITSYHVEISGTDVRVFSIRQITKINQALTALRLYIHLRALKATSRSFFVSNNTSLHKAPTCLHGLTSTLAFSVSVQCFPGEKEVDMWGGDRWGLGQVSFLQVAICPPSASAIKLAFKNGVWQWRCCGAAPLHCCRRPLQEALLTAGAAGYCESLSSLLGLKKITVRGSPHSPHSSTDRVWCKGMQRELGQETELGHGCCENTSELQGRSVEYEDSSCNVTYFWCL